MSGDMKSTRARDWEPRFEDRILFRTGLVCIGAFRCDQHHASFPESAPIENYCFWFPRTPVVIEPEHEKPFVANANIATFYHRAQTYRRQAVGDYGDYSDWFGFDKDLLRDALRERRPAIDEEPERLFPTSHRAVDAPTYLFQRQLFELVRAGHEADPFELEEAVVLLLDRILDHGGGAAPGPTPPFEKHRAMVADAELLLSRRFSEALSLNTIADHVGSSVFHLCRTFRRLAGTTLHQYRTSLRLRASLERVADSRDTLTTVAVDLGFASHSHFTSAFRREFGQLPSVFRATRGQMARN